MRTFIAVELPAGVRQNISSLVDGLKEVGSDVSWVAEQNLHITLKFLGEVAEAKVAGLLDQVAAQVGGTGSFPITLAGLGTFPAGRHPRVVWVGVGSGSAQLANLARALGEKEFVSHATIGRIKNNKGVDKLLARLAEIREQEFGAAEVATVSIMKSTLTPNGPRYEKIKEVKL